MTTPQQDWPAEEIHGGVQARLERALATAAEEHERCARALAENAALRAKNTGLETALAFYGGDGTVPACYAVALKSPQPGRHQNVLATRDIAVGLSRSRPPSAARAWRQVQAALARHGVSA